MQMCVTVSVVNVSCRRLSFVSSWYSAVLALFDFILAAAAVAWGRSFRQSLVWTQMCVTVSVVNVICRRLSFVTSWY